MLTLEIYARNLVQPENDCVARSWKIYVMVYRNINDKLTWAKGEKRKDFFWYCKMINLFASWWKIFEVENEFNFYNLLFIRHSCLSYPRFVNIVVKSECWKYVIKDVNSVTYHFENIQLKKHSADNFEGLDFFKISVKYTSYTVSTFMFNVIWYADIYDDWQCAFMNLGGSWEVFILL